MDLQTRIFEVGVDIGFYQVALEAAKARGDNEAVFNLEQDIQDAQDEQFVLLEELMLEQEDDRDADGDDIVNGHTLYHSPPHGRGGPCYYH